MDAEPWKTTFYDRMSGLRKAAGDGLKIAVLIYQAADTSTFRYRAYNISQQLEASDTWRAFYFFMDELDLLCDYIGRISVVSIVRVGWSLQLARFIERSRACGVPVLFDTDDLVVDIERIPLITNTLDVDLEYKPSYEYWFTYIGRLMLTSTLVDGFTTTNAFLAEQLGKKFNKDVAVIPNFLNAEQLAVSGAYRAQKQSMSGQAPFTLGYFSGTPSHINDFKVMHGELIRLMTEFTDIRLTVVGFMEFPVEFQPFLYDKRVTLTPLVDFLELQRLIAQVDVNLAPLVLNTFTNCKSELKFFEPAVVDTLTVASPGYTMRQCITIGENGYLCREGEWYDTLKKIYLDFPSQAKIVENARAYALENYTGACVTAKIEKAYEHFI